MPTILVNKIGRIANNYGTKTVFYFSNTLRYTYANRSHQLKVKRRSASTKSYINVDNWANKEAIVESHKGILVAHEGGRNCTIGHKKPRLDTRSLERRLQFFRRKSTGFNKEAAYIKQQSAFTWHPSLDIHKIPFEEDFRVTTYSTKNKWRHGIPKT